MVIHPFTDLDKTKIKKKKNYVEIEKIWRKKKKKKKKKTNEVIC